MSIKGVARVPRAIVRGVLHVMDYTEAIQNLYTIFSRDDSVSEKQLEALELGVDYLGVETGII